MRRRTAPSYSVCAPATDTRTDCGGRPLSGPLLPEEADGLGSPLLPVRLGAGVLAPGSGLPPDPSAPSPPPDRSTRVYVRPASASTSTASPATSTARARRSRPPGAAVAACAVPGGADGTGSGECGTPPARCGR